MDWMPLLRRWSRTLLQVPELRDVLPASAYSARWLGFEGVTEQQLAAAEARLGVTLPPSYRAFLRTTNGWGSSARRSRSCGLPSSSCGYATMIPTSSGRTSSRRRASRTSARRSTGCTDRRLTSRCACSTWRRR
jgi:hypothetical protein